MVPFFHNRDLSKNRIYPFKCKGKPRSVYDINVLSNRSLETKIHPIIDNRATLKVDMPILACTFFTFNWLTLTSEMHFVKFHPEVASSLLSLGKRKYAPLGMRLLWKYIRNYFLVYHLISHFLLYLQNYKEFEAEILDLQSEKYGLSLDVKKYTTSGWALGDENVIGIRAFKHTMSNMFQISHQALPKRPPFTLRAWVRNSNMLKFLREKVKLFVYNMH